jgi:uncharacterized hydrophobic protein (TIGR00341 family)
MALRLIELAVPESGRGIGRELRGEHAILDVREVPLPEGEVLVRILVDAGQYEAVLDSLQRRYGRGKEGRVVILPVEATLPRSDPEPPPAPGQAEGKPPARIGREELYEAMKDAAACNRVYLLMAVLSTVVAVVGLRRDSVALIIGAMVIAPLLGPNMAVALGTTLGDFPLLRRGILTGLAGTATAAALAIAVGYWVHVDPSIPEVAARTRVGIGDIAVALASGCAGALAFTTGVSAALIGVMVAVALLPPLVTFGLLLGGGHPALAGGALLLFLLNLICINLSAVAAFLVQGIRPATWWERDRASKATRAALGLWTLALAALVALLWYLRHR